MNRSEQSLQIAVVASLRALLPKPWLVFAVPNGGDAPSKRSHGLRKAMGVLAGVPDLLVVGPEHRMIALELKAPPKQLKTGVSKAKPSLSPAQQDVIQTLARCGVPTLIVRDLDECVRALTELGVPMRGRVQ